MAKGRERRGRRKRRRRLCMIISLLKLIRNTLFKGGYCNRGLHRRERDGLNSQYKDKWTRIAKEQVGVWWQEDY